MQEDSVESGPLGNWIATQLKHNNKILALINAYWILASSQQGPYCSLIQYNLAEKKSKSVTEYRKEIITQIKKYIDKNKEINDIIIAGDLN